MTAAAALPTGVMTGVQLVEKGSLLLHLATEQGKRTAVELFGSLKNMAQRLLDHAGASTERS